MTNPTAAQKLATIMDATNVTTKRSPQTSVPTDSWYPYYAGYTQSFVDAVIDATQLPTGSCILDPWNGSGTTTRAASERGYRAIGVDINPVAVLIASAKQALASDATHSQGFVKGTAQKCKRSRRKASPQDPLHNWLCPRLVDTYRYAQSHIIANLAAQNGKQLNPSTDTLPPLASFLLLALQRSARTFAGIKATTNPTWRRPQKTPPTYTQSEFLTHWAKTVTSMADDLEACSNAHINNDIQIINGDSRQLPLQDNSVDLVITSPPYCTRIDYVINTSFELATLEIGEPHAQFDDLRRGSMGTPLARKASPACATNFPDLVAETLSAIKAHPSKASSTYYYKTYAQYFTDAINSLKEIKRTLKPKKTAFLVVQSSYYKDIFVDLPELYINMAESLNMNASIAIDIDVTKFLSQINSRSTAHRKTTKHKESVITVETNP